MSASQGNRRRVGGCQVCVLFNTLIIVSRHHFRPHTKFEISPLLTVRPHIIRKASKSIYYALDGHFKSLPHARDASRIERKSRQLLSIIHPKIYHTEHAEI